MALPTDYRVCPGVSFSASPRLRVKYSRPIEYQARPGAGRGAGLFLIVLLLITMLLPLAFVTGGVHFLLNDQAIPAVAPQLKEWGVADYGEKKLKLGERDPIWMRSGTDILRAASSNPQSTLLEDVIIFRRDPSGILREQIVAKEAELQGDRWNLRNVIVYFKTCAPPRRNRSSS